MRLMMNARIRQSVKKAIHNPKQTIVLLSTLGLALLLLSTLFVKPYIGMADNGDFFREIHNVGLYYLTDNFDDRHFGYFNKIYGIRQFPYDQNTIFISSLSLLIRFALIVDLWLTADNMFDIRILALVYVIAFLIAFYMLLMQFAEKMSLPVIMIAAIAAVLIFGDVGYIAYFNSFYGEPASYVFLLLTVAFVFRLLKQKNPTVADFITFIIFAMLFVSAKQQNAPTALFVGALCVRLFFLRKDKPWKATVISSTVVLIALAGIVYGSITDDIKHINQYHAVTRGILENSKTPERDVKELGLDPKFSLLAGSTYYDKYSLENSESALLNKEFYPKFGYGSIIKFYMLHPDRAFEKLNLAANNAFAIRPEVMGNYEKSAGKPIGQKTTMFSLWSSIKVFIFPKTFKFILLFYALYYGGLSKFYFSRFRGNDLKGMIKLEVFALIGLIGISQFGVSFLGAGDADMAKHLFLFDVCFDFMFISMSIYALNWCYVKMRIGEKAGTFNWKQKRSISG